MWTRRYVRTRGLAEATTAEESRARATWTFDEACHSPAHGEQDFVPRGAQGFAFDGRPRHAGHSCGRG